MPITPIPDRLSGPHLDCPVDITGLPLLPPNACASTKIYPFSLFIYDTAPNLTTGLGLEYEPIPNGKPKNTISSQMLTLSKAAKSDRGMYFTFETLDNNMLFLSIDGKNETAISTLSSGCPVQSNESLIINGRLKEIHLFSKLPKTDFNVSFGLTFTLTAFRYFISPVLKSLGANICLLVTRKFSDLS